ncbi:MAG: hypothetical protein U0939_07040 [Pirellulales bacterium]
MTTVAPQLAPLRDRLSSLHRARRTARWTAAWSAVGAAVCAALCALWALDVRFELSVAQRLIMIALGGAALFWTYRRLAVGLLQHRESLLEVALSVERQHGIDTDLVAALQFESPDAAAWGSRQLENAVIGRVAVDGPSIDVFKGFDRSQANRRLAWLGVAAGTLLLASIVFPGHARVFWNRLLLGRLHYPTATQIQRIAINDQLVLDADRHGTSPRRSASAQSRPLAFLIAVEGEKPSGGEVRIESLRGGATRPIELDELTIEQRKAPVLAAVRALEDLANDPTASGPTIDDALVLPYLDCESPRAAEAWRGARESRGSWADARTAVQETLQALESNSERTAVYRGELGRMVESIEYKVFLGDAWTDAAEVAMTPRPLVEPRLSAQAPDYVSASEAVKELGPGRLTVLEGSRVQVGLACLNGKKLREAWLTLLTLSGPKRWNLKATDESGAEWSLAEADTPFARATEDLRFELQVRDEDGLTLETPLGGLVRVQPDRAPGATIQVVHKVILPKAKPVVQYRVLDDFAVGKIELHLEVMRRENAESAEGSGGEDRQSIVLSQPNAILRGAQLPFQGSAPVDLGPLQLEKGDRVAIVLEVTDYRGATPGQSFRSEPLALDVSDEAGVLSSVLEADQRAEERLSEIIKRQLGIGESP